MGNKGVFVGLGGAGVQAVAHLKAKLLRTAGSIEELNKDCKFIFIDSARDEVDRMNSKYRSEFPEQLIRAGGELVNVGPSNPKQMYDEASRRDKLGQASPEHLGLLSYIDYEATLRWKNESLEKGASGDRQLGRTGILNSVGLIETALSSAVTELYNQFSESFQDKEQEVPVYLFSGTCGGTASSSFLDVAYVLDRTIKNRFSAQETVIRAVLFLPPEFVAKNEAQFGKSIGRNYIENGFGFLEELKYFLKDRWNTETKIGEAFSRITVLDDPLARAAGVNSQWRVFNFAVCIDNQSEFGGVFTLDQMVNNAAELMYYWHSGHSSRTVIGKLDNVLAGQYRDLTKQRGTTPAFAGMGYRALQFPEDLLREYFRKRFIFEFFNYGILGSNYKDALPEAERKNEVLKTFNDCIARYLDRGRQADKEIINLQVEWEITVENSLTDINDIPFRKAGFLDKKLRGKQDVEGAPDPDLIADSSILRSLVTRAKTAIAVNQRTMSDRFDSDSNIGRKRLLNIMRFGAAEGDAGASIGPSLENAIENSILRVGLNYTKAFVAEVENKVDVMIKDLHSERETILQAAENLHRQEDELMMQCLSGSNRKKVGALENLIATLHESVRNTGSLGRIDQQLKLLLDLSIGEQGILDHYRQNIDSMINLVHQEIVGSNEGTERNIGLMDQYKVELERQFADTKNNITTTYIPDVSSFTVDGSEKHLFSDLYHGVISQTMKSGGFQPVRYGTEKEGDHVRIDGLHKILEEMLTHASITGREGGFGVNGQIVFFRNHFGARNKAQEMFNDLSAFAGKYIDNTMALSKNVQDELGKNLKDRFDGLSKTAREALKENFSDAGTQIFCRFTNFIDPHYVTVYVAKDKDFAKTMGFVENDNTQFVETDEPHRFLKLKFVGQQQLDNLNFYRSYENVYLDSLKRQENFFPHIHKLFNKHGVERGMKLVHDLGEIDPFKNVVQGLLYWRLFEEVKKKSPGLLNEVIHIDASKRGSEKTLDSPVLIEKIGSTSRKAISVIGNIHFYGDKITLRQADFIRLGAGSSYADIYDLVKSNRVVLGALLVFDRMFRDLCSLEWAGFIESCGGTLRTALADASESSPDQRGIYDNLVNRLDDLVIDLQTHIESRPSAGSISKKSDGGVTHF